MTRLELQAQTTQTSAFDGAGVDISGIAGDWTITVEVFNLSAGSVAVLSFEDSVDSFSNHLEGPDFCLQGPIQTTSAGAKVMSVKKSQFPSLRFGTPSATLRLRLISLNGVSPTITYRAQVLY
jgi:hypothetical protein